MKHIIIRLSKQIVIPISLLLAVLYLFFSQRTTACLCSILTQNAQSFKIDAMLNPIIDLTTLHEGTFTRIITSCEHDVRIYLTIYPDDGFYIGYKRE